VTSKGPAVTALLLLGLFVAATLPLILSDYDHGRGAADQDRHHYPVIRRWAAEWPHCNVSEYDSATTPGYHLILATAGHWLGTDRRFLRGIGALFTAGLLVTLGMAAGRRRSMVEALVLCLPVLCSIYVFSSGAWLLPDNAGWWGVLALLLLGARFRWGGRGYIWAGVLFLALVAVRQSHVWCAAALWLSGWLADDDPMAGTSKQRRRRWARAGWMFLVTLPGLLLLLAFTRAWHGLTPPHFQAALSGRGPSTGGGAALGPALRGLNLSALPMILAIVATASAFFLGHASLGLKAWARGDRFTRTAVRTGLLVGLLTGLLPQTSYSPPHRWSGLWILARLAPSIGHRSPVVIVLSTLGGGMVGLWLSSMGARERRFFAGSLLAFAAAQTANQMAWQRYYEPFVLLLLVLMICASREQATSGLSGDDNRSREGVGLGFLRIAGPLLLAAVLAIITVWGLR
jgi:hypothetical protein